MGSAAAGGGDRRPPLGALSAKRARAPHGSCCASPAGAWATSASSERMELRKLAAQARPARHGLRAAWRWDAASTAAGAGRKRPTDRSMADDLEQALHARAARPRRAPCRAPPGRQVLLVAARAGPRRRGRQRGRGRGRLRHPVLQRPDLRRGAQRRRSSSARRCGRCSSTTCASTPTPSRAGRRRCSPPSACDARGARPGPRLGPSASCARSSCSGCASGWTGCGG